MKKSAPDEEQITLNLVIQGKFRELELCHIKNLLIQIMLLTPYLFVVTTYKYGVFCCYAI